MFALWYISLALDEIRKHLGWSSIFDIFKTNKTANNKVLDDNNKPSSTINAAAKKEQPSSSNATNSTKIPENAPKTATPAVIQKAPEPKPEPPKSVELPKPTPTVTPSPPPTSTPTVQPQPETQQPLQPQPQSQPETKSPTISSTDTNRGTFANDPLDKKLFAPSNPLPFENGDDTEKPKANIKDATTSFLAGEGSKAGFDPKSKQVQDFTSQR